MLVAIHNNPSIERSSKFRPVHSLNERKMMIKSIKYIDKIISYNLEKDQIKILKNKRFAKKQIKSYKKKKYEMNPPLWDFMWGTYCGMNNLLAVYHKNNLSRNDGNDEYAFHSSQMLLFMEFFKKSPPIKKCNFQ